MDTPLEQTFIKFATHALESIKYCKTMLAIICKRKPIVSVTNLLDGKYQNHVT